MLSCDFFCLSKSRIGHDTHINHSINTIDNRLQSSCFTQGATMKPDTTLRKLWVAFEKIT